MQRHLVLLVSAAGLALATHGTGTAGGLYLNELMTTSQGAAGAGAGAIAEDASTAFFNPAGMARLKGRHLTLGAGLVAGDVKFEPSPLTPVPGGNGGQQGGPAPILSTFYTHQLGERWTAGASLYSISGAALDPDDTWTGRYQLEEITLLTLTGGVSVSYKATDWLSLGVGAGAVFGIIDFDLATPPLGPGGTEGAINLEGTDIAPAFTAGALVELSPETRIGVTAFSGFSMEFDGDLTLAGLGVGIPSTTKLDFAPFVRISGYHELTDEVTLLGTIGWEGWSVLDELVVSGPARSAAVARDWDDTWHFSAGVRYHLSPEWMLQTGFAYDTSPTTARLRTADTPIDRQLRFAVGARYKLRDDLSINGSFVYADYGDAPIAGPVLSGEYKKNDLYFFGLNLEWKVE